MNVLITVANLERGGQQRMALLLAEGISDIHNVTFLVFTKKTYWGQYSIPDNIDFMDINCEAEEGKIKKALNVIRRSKTVREIKKKRKIDVSISFGESANLVNCFSKVKEKVITSIRGSMVLENGISWIDRFTFSRSDNTVFISNGQRNAYASLIKKYAHKMIVVYNACDLDRIKELSTDKTDIPVDDHTFVAVGRVVSVKCFYNLINAFKIVVESHSNYKLYVIGDGLLMDKLKKHIEECKMSNSVFMLGDKDNPFAYVSKARALLNSSGRESFSNVVLEGLACGVPVISTDCRFGPREILSGDYEYKELNDYSVCDYGVLTPRFDYRKGSQPDKENAFAAAINKLLSDSELEQRLRSVATKRSECFSKEKYISNWLKVIE